MYLYRIIPAMAALFSTVNSLPLSPRAPIDVCASIDTTLSLTFNVPGIGVISMGSLNVCLCISAVPLFVTGTVKGQVLVALFGSQATAITKLTTLINTLGKHCTYPDHSDPICSPSDPCGFDCKDGYQRVGNQCTCPSPRVDCNGKCKPQGTICSSSVPLRRRADWRDAMCPSGWSVCGEYSRGHLAHRCVDTDWEVMSCGGCVLRLSKAHKIGTDCTQIPDSIDVSCIAGTCQVDRCESGFTVSQDNLSCVPLNENAKLSKPRDYQDLSLRTSSGIIYGDLAVASRGSLGRDVLVLDNETLALLATSTNPLSVLVKAWYKTHAKIQSRDESKSDAYEAHNDTKQDASKMEEHVYGLLRDRTPNIIAGTESLLKVSSGESAFRLVAAANVVAGVVSS